MDPITAGLVAALWPALATVATDAAKDFFRKRTSAALENVLGGQKPKPEVLQAAVDSTIACLLAEFQRELERHGTNPVDREAIGSALRALVELPRFADYLGGAFGRGTVRLSGVGLAQHWRASRATPALPPDFAWDAIADALSNHITAVRVTDPELRARLEVLLAGERTDAAKGGSRDFDLEPYRKTLRQRYPVLDLVHMGLPQGQDIQLRIWDVFVPPRVRACDGQHALLNLPKEFWELEEAARLLPEKMTHEERERLKELKKKFVEQPPRPALDVLRDPAERLVVILGDPGAGKSMLLRHLSLEWANTEDSTARLTAPLPLLIEFREFDNWRRRRGRGDFLDYMADTDGIHRLNRDEMERLLATPGSAVLFLDALDEVFNPADRRETIQLIRNVANDFPDLPIVLTSRHYQYDHAATAGIGFRHYMLQDFQEDAEIPRFLEKWFRVIPGEEATKTRRREAILRAVRDTRAIRTLARNPLLLTLIALISRTRELPRQRAELYEEASKMLLYYWDVERVVRDFDPEGAIGHREKSHMLQNIAHAMQTGADTDRGNVIEEATLEGIICDYLTKEISGLRGTPKGIARKVIEELSHRNFILSYIGAGHYAFIHRTFLEYFTSQWIIRELMDSSRKQDLRDLVRRYWMRDSWTEVFRLLAGSIPKTEQVVELIGWVLEERDGRNPEAHYFLGAEMYGELRSRPASSQTIREHLLKALIRIYKAGFSAWTNVEVAEKAAQLIIRSHLCIDPLAFVQDEVQVDKGRLWRIPLEALIAEAISLYRNDPALREYAKGWAPVSPVALDLLVERWPTLEETFFVVRSLAQEGNEVAVRFLAEKWPERPETFRILWQLAGQGVDEAIAGLAQGWLEDDAVITLLHDLARVGNDEALIQLIHGLRNENATLILLRELAQSGNLNAMFELVSGWRDDEETLAIVRNLAREGDPDALEILIQWWREDPETLNVLKDQARQGNLVALSELAGISGQGPEIERIVFYLQKNGYSLPDMIRIREMDLEDAEESIGMKANEILRHISSFIQWVNTA